jgi:hypothetical protein
VASGDNGGNDCEALITNPFHSYPGPLQLQSSSKWDTDTWNPTPQPEIAIDEVANIESDGGFLRGCHNETVWFPPGAPQTITVDVTWPWGQDPTTTCTASNPQAFQCIRQDQNGTIGWAIQGS